MRGTASIASTVTLRAASRSISSLFCAGQMKLISVAPGFSRSASCAAARPRDRLPHLEDDVRLGVDAVRVGDDRRARLDVGGVGEVRRVAGARLDHDLEAELDASSATVSGVAATRRSCG